MEKAFKFRIYPSEIQKDLIERTFGTCRFVYNRFLFERKNVYEKTGKGLTYNQQATQLPVLKQKFEWLKQVDSTALQSACRQLDTAYQNFFHGLKTGKMIGFPKYKTKRNPLQSYTSKMSIKVFDSHIQLPKLGKVKCRISRPIQGRILSATVSRTASGKYFASVCCRIESEDVFKLPPTGNMIGLDMGFGDLLVDNHGNKYENLKYLSKSEKRLARAQRRLSRKSKGSKRYAKNKLQVARIHEHITNQRKDALHKATTNIIRENDIICIEDLDVKSMQMCGDRSKAKSASDASLRMCRSMLTYKANWYGRKLQVVDRFYPSSQLCSCCGYRNPVLKDLNIRKWTCPRCGSRHDRDANAAKNILQEGLRMTFA